MLVDWFFILLAYLYVFGIIYTATILKHRNLVSGQLARKMVHLGIGAIVIIAPLLFSNRWYPVAIGISFIVITFITSPVSPIIRLRLAAFKDGHGFGTVYYSVSLTFLLLLFYQDPWIIQVGFLPLAFGDAFANLIGKKYGSSSWRFAPDKSKEGTLAAFSASFLVLCIVLSMYQLLGLFAGTFVLIFVISFSGSISAAFVELISPLGLDNLTIPVICTGIAISFLPLTS